jgi:Ser/Thr protein kinase RdoA (MazF antagonist)
MDDTPDSTARREALGEWLSGEPESERRPSASARQEAEYLAHMALALAQRAKRGRFEFLGYLLEMSAIEADAEAARAKAAEEGSDLGPGTFCPSPGRKATR